MLHVVQNNALKILNYTVFEYTIKPSHAVTSFKQSPVLKGYVLFDLSYKISYEMNLY